MGKEKPSLLQKQYIQKSYLFLLPLVGLKRNKYFKENTYISCPDLISTEYSTGIDFKDQILIITYSKLYKVKQDNLYNQVNANFKDITIEETGWDKQDTELISNKRFLAFHESKDEYIYTFDMSDWYEDWAFFMEGRYTKMSSNAKQLIKDYRWTSLLLSEQRKLYCYLYSNEDEACFKDFAEELEVPIKNLRRVKELCNKPDLELETYKCSQKLELDEAKV